MGQWKVRLAFAGGGLALVASVGGCPTAPDWPPFVRSGPAGGDLVAGSSTETDGGGGGEDSGNLDGGGEQPVACTYLAAGATVDQCAIQPSSDVTATEDNCTGSGNNQLGGSFEVGNCPATVAGNTLVGCCPGAGTSFQAPAWTCYYSGTVTMLTSQCAGTFQTTLPTSP